MSVKESLSCSQCKKLQAENLLLQKELSLERANYCQLLKESNLEKFGERRVNLLKAQILQLERQISLLSQDINRYTELCADIRIIKESSLQKINAISECYKSDKELLTKLKSLKDELLNLKIKHKVSVTQCNIVYTGRYSTQQDVSLIDIINNGQSDITNISWLEGQISILLEYIIKLESSLRVIPNITTPTISSLDPLYTNANIIHSIATQCLQQCSQVGQELLTLSLLIPGQTRHKRKKNYIINIKQLLQELPPFSTNRQLGKELLENLVTIINESLERLTNKVSILEDGLVQHKQLYSKHLLYFDKLLSMISDGHQEFLASLQDTIGVPIKKIINSYYRHIQENDISVLLECLNSNVPLLSETFDRLNEILSVSSINGLLATNHK